jgi:hypothetical protein
MLASREAHHAKYLPENEIEEYVENVVLSFKKIRSQI